MKILETKTELMEYLKSIGYNKQNFRIAVEALIFKDEKLVLLLRSEQARDESNKLEGVGGTVYTAENLLDKLREEIEEEIALDREISVKIERLLEVRQVQFKDNDTNKLVDWVVVSHLCHFQWGNIFNNEPTKHKKIMYLTLDELYNWPEEPIFNKKKELIKPGLSKSLIMGRKIYKQKYGNRPYYEVAEEE